jgi:hypothetical protein
MHIILPLSHLSEGKARNINNVHLKTELSASGLPVAKSILYIARVPDQVEAHY